MVLFLYFCKMLDFLPFFPFQSLFHVTLLRIPPFLTWLLNISGNFQNSREASSRSRNLVNMWVCTAPFGHIEKRYQSEIWYTHSPWQTFFSFIKESDPKGRYPRKTAVSRGFSAYPLDCHVFVWTNFMGRLFGIKAHYSHDLRPCFPIFYKAIYFILLRHTTSHELILMNFSLPFCLGVGSCT